MGASGASRAFPEELVEFVQAGGRADLIKPLPHLKAGETVEWRSVLLTLSRIRGELAVLVADAFLSEALAKNSDPTTAEYLVKAGASLIETYKEGRPPKYVQDALEGVQKAPVANLRSMTPIIAT